nr:tetratricopeptide repeat protein [Gammaproteobacteria bacterium]
HLLGVIAAQRHRNAEALELLTRAIAASPTNPLCHNNLGNVLLALGRLDEAIAAFRRAVQLQPEYAEAHNNLGIALFEQGNLDQAILNYRRALAQQPRYSAAYNNLGNALYRQGHMSEANAAYAEAIRIRPDYAEAYFNLGVALQEQGRFDRARAAFTYARERRSDYVEARNFECVVTRQLCLWDGFDSCLSEVREQVRDTSHATLDPFFCLSLPLTAAEQHRCAARQVAVKLAPVFSQRNRLKFSFTRGPRQVLRIGYLSADFRQHATSCLLAEVLEKHDRRRFCIAAYSYGPDDRSPLRDRVASACDHFIDIREHSHDAAASLIYQDKVDILVDLMGYTRYARPQITALRPAPVQVNYLGYPGTCGAEWVDYIIADPNVIPRALGDCYSERVVVLPDSYQPNDRTRPIGCTPDRRACDLPESALVFCNFNQTYKITPAMFDVWMRILRTVPGSVLWLLESNRWAPDNLRREAAVRGIDADRLIFAPKLPMEAHLGRLRNADLCIDTFPYTSHTTGSDALWTGVPLVTMTGETFASRVAASLLCTLGVPELVTDSIDAYFNLAWTLARTPDKLTAIKSKIESNRRTSPLFDSDRYTRNLESAYETMWENYRLGGSDKFLSVKPWH